MAYKTDRYAQKTIFNYSTSCVYIHFLYICLDQRYSLHKLSLMVATVKANAGYTLVEILLTIGILSIISGVAYVSYRGHTLNANKNDLKIHAELFASAVKNCIAINGGRWAITLLKPDGTVPTDAEVSQYIKTPCEARGTTQKAIKDDLKKKLDFTCPADATCETYTHGNPGGGDKFKYHCLSIKKTVSGKYLQVLSRVSYKTGAYQIWCKEGEASSDLVSLHDGTCKKSKGWSGINLETDKGFKQDNDCWK